VKTFGMRQENEEKSGTKLEEEKKIFQIKFWGFNLILPFYFLRGR